MCLPFPSPGELDRAEDVPQPPRGGDQRGGGGYGSAGAARPGAQGAELEGREGLHGQG